MNKQEKVINGMECCIKRMTTTGRCDYDCPYYHNPHGCKVVMLKDAISLSKAQEPRVMTLEELKSYLGKPVWIEEKGCEPYCEVVFDMDGVCFGLTKGEVEFGGVITGHAMFAVGGYGSIFRAWTEEPTDEQREATPWPEPPKEMKRE